MELSEWAKHEVELASAENEGYGKACMNSAIKAFLSLCDDDHSGMSIGFAADILNRLIKCKPLTPLTGADDEWYRGRLGLDDENCDPKTYQNKRCSSVFKKVWSNGDVTYNDIDRMVFEDINTGARFTSGMLRDELRSYLPDITFPYMPESKPYVFYTEDFLVDAKNGSFDTRAVFYMISPTGENTKINLYQEEIDGKMVGIELNAYMERRANRLYGTMDPITDTDLEHSAIKDVNDMVKKLDGNTGQISDGYHTFDELYFHRMKLFSIICNTYKDVAWKSWKHDDDSMYDGMFIVGVTLPNGDYSYHYNKEFWDDFDVRELPNAPKWDGHKPEDIDRLDILVK